MKFLKKRKQYNLMYSDKKEILKMLKADYRVDNVEWVNDYELLIITKPINPISYNNQYKEKKILLYPIGRYKIELSTPYSSLHYSINRIYGGLGYKKDIIHPHITHGSICWGTASEEVDTIRWNNDYFWLAKKCLDLLEDGDLENRNFIGWCKVMVGLQCEHLKRSKPKRKFFKIIDLRLKHRKYLKEHG